MIQKVGKFGSSTIIAKVPPKNEQKKVKKFQERVKGLEYKRLSAKYSSGYQRQRVHKIHESMKTPIRQVMDTVSPLITVLVTLLCCLVMSNYFLKNIIHEMAGRIAFGLVVGSVLGLHVFQNY